MGHTQLLNLTLIVVDKGFYLLMRWTPVLERFCIRLLAQAPLANRVRLGWPHRPRTTEFAVSLLYLGPVSDRSTHLISSL